MSSDFGDRPTAAARLLLQAALYLFGGGQVAEAWEKAREAKAVLNADARSPDELLWQRAFTSALFDALQTARVNVQQNEAELAAAISDELATSLETSSAFGETELTDPVNFAAYPPVRERFPAFVRRIDPAYAAEVEAEPLRERLDAALRRGVRRAWSEDTARFQSIVDRFRGPIAEGARREAAWMRHWEWVRRKYDVDPLLSADGAELSIPIARVYIPLRGVWHEELDAEPRAYPRYGPEPEPAPAGRRAHVGSLHGQVRAWLDAGTKDDLIRLIAGGPGSGKSSFATAFATHLILETHWRVIFIESQHLQLSGSLRKDLAGYFRHRSAGGAGFADDPLGWRDEDRSPYLLIFDSLEGLGPADDRQSRGSHFLRNLKQMLQQSGGFPPPRALVLGRSTVVQEGRRQANLPLETLFHVLPLRPPTRRDLLLPAFGPADDVIEIEEDVKDDEGLLANGTSDQRYAYWRRWQEATGAAIEPIPEGLTCDRLTELTGEPLLLHFLITLRYFASGSSPESADRQHSVYEEVFLRLVRREKREKEWLPAQIDEKILLHLLECLALTTWGRMGSVSDEDRFQRVLSFYIETILEHRRLPAFLYELRTVAQMFYVRSSVHNDSYKFINASFEGYLIARSWLAYVFHVHKREKEKPISEIMTEWTKLSGTGDVTPFILYHLRDQLTFLPYHVTYEIKNLLERWMNFALEKGLPAHQIEEAVHYRVIELYQSQSESALLAALNSIARCLAKEHFYAARLRFIWPCPLAMLGLMNRLRRGRDRFLLAGAFEYMGDAEPQTDCCQSVTPAPHVLKNADASYVSLINTNLQRADLRGANFTNANLSATDMADADLTNANLCDANLTYATLSGAELVDADLRRATLLNANLDHAVLRAADLRNSHLANADAANTDFREARLIGADCFNIDLRGAECIETVLCRSILYGANLLNAILWEADLRYVDLRGANCRQADLGNAVLRGARLDDADLFGANLDGADLRGAFGLNQSQINKADGSLDTRVVEGLVRPAHWKD